MRARWQAVQSGGDTGRTPVHICGCPLWTDAFSEMEWRMSSVALDELADALALLGRTNGQITRLTRLRARLEKQIKTALGDGELGTIAGQPVATYKRTLR